MAEDKKQSVRLRLWLWRGSGVVLVLVFFVTRYFVRDVLPVRVARAGHERLINTTSTNGRVEPEINYPFYSPLPTTVKAVHVLPGDHVEAGKLLLELDDVDARAKVASAESGVKAAQAAVEAATHNGTLQERQASAGDAARFRLDRDQAQKDLNALTKLQQTGAASASEVAAAQERLNTAETNLHSTDESAHNRYSPAEVARAQATLNDAEAGLAAAREVLAKTSARAPAAGTIYTLDASHGDFVEAGKLLLQMADLSHERVRAYFDEPEIGRLAVGQSILIKWDAKPGREWHGHIIRTPVSVVTYGTRNVGEVLVAIDDADSGLLPDTNVTVTVTTSSDPDALTVPREALHSENGKPYVFKVAGDKLERTPVTVGTANLTQAPILSGLQEGDMVATGATNGQPLQEGVPIKVVR